MYVCVYVYMYMYVYVCVYIYIYIYIYIYMLFISLIQKSTSIIVVTECLQTLFDGIAIRHTPLNASTKYIWCRQKAP